MQRGPLPSAYHLEWEPPTASKEIDRLAFPDFSKPFTLHTDASTQGLSAVLYQEQAGKMWVISYASLTLTESEKKATTFILEK